MEHVLLALIVVSLLSSLKCTSANIGRLQGLYMGWLGHANLGDELVLDIFGHLLRDTLLLPGMFQRVSLEYQQPRLLHNAAALNFSAYGFGVLGGGSLLETSTTHRTGPCQGVRDAKVPLYVHGTGTQLPYTEYDERNLRCVEPPVWGGVRGPLTHALLANMSAHFNSKMTGHELPIFGDSGILADRIFPRFSRGIMRALNSSMADASSDPVVCVSGAVQFGRPNTPNFRDTAELIEAWAKTFIVILLPVDPSTAHKQKAMYTEAMSSNRVKAGRLLFNGHINHYGVWLALLARCDLLLTVRLHAAVMAAAAGVPFIMPYYDTIPTKAKDFLMGTVGEGTWQQYFVRQSDFDGSTASMSELLHTVSSRATHQKAAFTRAASVAYSSYMSSLKAFADVIIPNSYRSFAEVNIRIDRYFENAILDLTFT